MSENIVKLGLMPPLTGLVGIYGTEIARAGQIACQEVNENGGVLGRPLELVIEDDGSLPDSAVAAAEKLVDQHGCVAIIGNLLSNSRIAVAYRVAEPRKIPYLNFSFYEGSIQSRYFFHFAALPNQQIDRMIPYMRAKFGPRMFFAGNNYEWPRGSIDAAKRALLRAGGEVLGEEYTPIGVDAAGIEHLLDQVEAAAPDVFVPYFAGVDQVNLLTRFTERGMKRQMAVVMGHYDEMMASMLSPEVRAGFYSSNSYFMTVDTAANRDYLARLAALPGVSGIWPKGNGILTNFGEGAYVCVKAFAKAANAAGSLDAEALVDVLKTLSVASPQGTVRMDPATQHAQVNTYLSRCGADGAFEIIERFGAIAPQLPERYNHQRIGHQATLEDDIRLQARMLEQMAEGVLLVNSNDESIVYANAGADRMFGYANGELIGKHLAAIHAPSGSDRQDIATDPTRLVAQKGSWQGEVRSRSKSGATLWCNATLSTFTHPVFGEVWLGVYSDITETKRLQQEIEGNRQQLEVQVRARTAELVEREKQLHLAQSIAQLGHWSVNFKTGELLWSEQIYRIFGRDKEQFHPSYENFVSCVHPDDRALVKASEEQSFIVGRHSVDHRVVRPDGTIRWVHEEAQLERDASGEPLRLTGTVQDITNRKEIETALTEAKTTAEGANRAKSEFLSRMSHELRTPMNAILGFAQVLEAEALSPEHADFVQEIHRAGDHLLELINELLDLARIETGKLAVVLQTIDLKVVVNEAVSLIQPLLATRQIVLLNECAEPPWVLADHSRLRQVLINLLSNAVKYNRAGGGVTLACQVVDAATLRLGVSDTGPGLAPEKLDLLFKPFARLGAEFTEVEGSGIGLALSRELLLLMGGRIGVESAPGRGSTFWIELPLAAAAAEMDVVATTAAATGSAAHPAQRATVLYVEDNPANLKLVEVLFKRYPHLHLLSANDGTFGLELARSHRPDVVLLDIHLPGMDGYAILAALKADAATRDIPVIALSADAMTIDVELGLKSGFLAYLTKPVQVGDLMTALRQALPPDRR